MNVGDLVVVLGEPELGVGRLERLLDGGRARIWLYALGRFVIRPASALAPCPPNTPVAPGGG
jgi:hypothetical protein